MGVGLDICWLFFASDVCSLVPYQQWPMFFITLVMEVAL